MSAFTRFVTLICFVVLGTTADVSAQCPGGSCSITCPPDISLCLAPDNYGHTAITADWVASHTSSPNPQCNVTRVWKDAMGMEELTEPIWVDCDDVHDHVDLWVSREKYLWPECRSSLVKVRVHIKDCEPPAIACPPMAMYVCNDDVNRPGYSIYIWPFGTVKLINQTIFQDLGGSASDACGLDGVIYWDQITSTDPNCKTNRTIKRTFVVFDVNGNYKSCTQEIVVADNEPPKFDADPADLTINCDAAPATMVALITQWLGKNTHPGNQDGPDAVVTDRCDENMVMIEAVPSSAAIILSQMPAACDPNPRAVTVVFTANDGCGNQATRSARVRLIDNVPPTVPAIPDLTVQCADDVPPEPNTDVVTGESDNCTPTDKLKVELVDSDIVPGDCENRFYLYRTYHITDCSGNTTTRTHSIRVYDNIDPTWDPNPQNKFMMDVCDPAVLLDEINEWLDDGYGRAKDNCDDVTVTANKSAADIRDALLDFCDQYEYLGTYNGHSYFFSNEPAYWTEAHSVATSLGGYLASVNDAGENAFLAAFLAGNGGPQNWLGGNDVASEGTWVWSNGAPWVYTNWNGGEPNNLGGVEDYLTMYGPGGGGPVGTWNDQSNVGDPGVGHPFIIEFNSDIQYLNIRFSAVHFTATDACGNTSERRAVIRLMDTKAPTGTPPPDITYSCPTNVPDMNTNQVTNLEDNCTAGNTVKVDIESNPTPGYGCADNPNIIIRKWRLTDCAGNTRIVSQVITIQDKTAPVWNVNDLPKDLSVDCDRADLGDRIQDWLDTNGDGGSASDACTSVTYSHHPTNVNDILNALGKCAPYNGTTTVTFIAKDDCGNTATTTATLTVFDNNKPTASAQDDTYSCPADVPAPDPSVFNDEDDDCSPNPPTFKPTPVVIQNNLGKGCMGDPLIITRWYELSDCAGNTTTVSHQITVVDMIAPQAICQPLTRYLDANGMVMVNAGEFNNGSFDNCGIKKIEIRRGDSGPWFDKLTFDCADIPDIPNCGAFVENSAIITIQMRVTDNCDQTDICTTTITVVDNEPPTIECPDDMTFYTSENGGYDCKATATWTHPSPHDNCSVKCMTMEVQKEINGVFTTVNPANGFPTPNLQINVIGEAGEEVSYLWGKGPYCDDNQYKIIYRVRDEHGNTKPEVMCMFFITIKDDEKPEWNNCPESPIVAQTVTGDCYQMKCWTRPTAYDNCEYPSGPCPAPTVVVTVSDPTVMINQVGDEDCALFPVGTTYVYYTATDAEGNVSTCTVEVQISDDEDPVAMCAGPFTVNMEPDGLMQLSIADIDAPGTSDNCGICSKGISRNPACCFGPTVNLTCADVGTTVRVYMKVADCSRPDPNTATCYSDVTVQDMQSPGVAFCPQDITVGTDNNVCKAKVNYTAPLFNDGCSSPKAGTLIQGPASGATLDAGIYHVQYCYTSASGFTVCCDFNITVVDDQAPSITCPADKLNLTCLEILPAPMTAVQMQNAGLLSDNCGITLLEFSDYDNDLTHCQYDGIRTIIRTYTAWDAAGNSSTCSQKFQYLEDTQDPVLQVTPPDLPDLKCADQIPPVPNQWATDNCGTVNIDFSEEIQPGGCENQLVVIRRWVATDLCGRTDEHVQTITVHDDVDPVLTVTPLDLLQYDCSDDVQPAPAQIATDNCGIVYVDFYETVYDQDCPNEFKILRRWVATDLCGNTDEHEQIIRVRDWTPPVLTVTPIDLLNYDCSDDVKAAPAQVAYDNCDVVFVDFYETVYDHDCPNDFKILRRWVATDLCGNTAEHEQTIRVRDWTPPVLLTTPLDLTQLKCADEVPEAPVGNATDNCEVNFVDFAETTIFGDCPNQFSIVRRWEATDLCGNTDEHWQTITVHDDIPPVLEVTPLDITFECSEDVPPVPPQEATDNCDIVYIDFSEEIQPGGCEDQFKLVRTWLATDLCGNTDIHVWTITVNDTKAPEWDQDEPESKTVECSEDVPPMPLQTATDNCGALVALDIVETTEPGTCPNQYVVIRTWTAQDVCGNATTRTQVITVSDTEAPEWNEDAPEDKSVECSEDVPAIPAQTATDNCDEPLDVEFYETYDLGSCPNSFVLTRVWTAEDDCGNRTMRVQVITVSDTEAPVWDQDAPESPVTGQCADEVPDVPVQTATDNCDVPVYIEFNEVIDWGACLNQFDVIRTWTAVDDCGNATTRTQIINIFDDTDPIVTPPAAITLDCGDISETSDPAAIIDDFLAAATATDNCDQSVWITHDFDATTLDVCVGGTLTVTWTAADACGNTGTATSTITVIPDTEDPVVTAPAPITLDCGDISETTDPSAIVTNWLESATAEDNCDTDPELTYSFDVTTLDVCVGGTLTVTWTATDHCGNVGTSASTITVVPDTEDPVVTAPAAITLDCGDISETTDPGATISNWLESATATDNCDTDPELTFDFDVTTLDVCVGGTLTVTWTATDHCGNVGTATSTITVVPDTEDPVVTAPAPITLDCGDISETTDPGATISNWLESATATDNCDTDPELTYNFDVTTLDVCVGGTLTVTWTATDHCGNVGTATSTITVVPDTEDPVVTAPDPITLDCGDISETTDPGATISNWLESATATDNCDTDPELTYNFDVTTLDVCVGGTLTVTWTATDHCGNVGTATSTITVVPDTEDPVVTAPDPITLDCGDISETADPSAIVSNWLASATTTDNCDTDPAVTYNFDITTLDVCVGGTLTVTWTATDHCGNVGTSASTITVVPDTEDPVVTAPDPITLDCGDISETTDPAATIDNWLASATATDNCDTDPAVSYNFDVTTLDVCVGGTLTVTWTAVDHCGNVGTATSTITVVPDTEDPTIVVPDPLTLDCEDINPVSDPSAIVLDWLAQATASDNCDNDPALTYDFDVTTLNVCVGGTLVVTWTATDACGNLSTATSTIIVIADEEAPVLAGVPGDISVEVKCAADVPGIPVVTATDNCTAPVDVEFTEVEVPGACANKYTIIRTWTAEDACGNLASFVYTIVVNDDVAPELTCPGPLFAQCSPGEHPPYANLTEFETAGGTASDNCGLFINSFGLLSEVQNGNVYTRTYRVYDQCGNSATCEQTVTVEDTEPPVFLNCPVGPLVFGNDPDKCSAKINWPDPVAVDNCSIPTVVQTSGPTAGSVVPVGNYTVVFVATDAMGNTTVCSFDVMVMDTQNPEFDADIVMPANVTVECDNVPAPFVLTTDDVHDNCTPSNLLDIDFTEVRTDGNCKFNYTLTRTWTVTDEAGNQLIHTQIVTVRDTKAPIAKCKNATVTLDKFGNATVTAGMINDGSTDNCSLPQNLTFTVTPNAFTCANLGANVVTLRVTDECGNSATCTATVTVLEGPGPCTPQISVKTVCKDNATTLDNGQFEDLITVKSLAMQTWTVTSNTGLYSASSAAPPAAPTPLPNNAPFTAGTADGIDNDSDGQIDEADEMVYYTLKGVHVEAIGYSIQIRNNLNQTGTISNKGYYPTPYFINLNDPFCLNTPPFTIQVGEYNNAQGTVESIMVNGVLTNIFDAEALGIGFHTVMATFNAGTPTTNLVINGQLVGGTDAQALADPGCKQKITKIVQITDTPPVVVCNDLVHISIANDGGDCVFVVEPDDVLEGSYGCFDDYSVVLTYPNGTHSFNPPNRVDYTHIGKFLNYSLKHAVSGNVCWGQIKVEDKEPPILTCPSNITIACSDPTSVNFTGQVLVSDCHPTVTIVDTDDFTDYGACADPRAQIIRTWLVTDGSGNQSSCTQRITIKAFDLNDVQFPDDITISCSSNYSTDPNATGVPTINGSPIGSGGLCMASISKTDEYYDICNGSFEIVRTWKVRNMCLPVGPGNPVEGIQVIKIIDTNGPVFDCPEDVTVSIDPFACCSTAPLPDVIITETCSYVTSLTYKIVGIDVNTGNLVIHEGFGSLSNFPGNNLWHPDTLGVFGFSQCLPRGTYSVTYTAVDACGNISKCEFELTVEDQIPPISACDEFTQVGIGGDGNAFVNASTFDDGSYDLCNPVYFKARRMDPYYCTPDGSVTVDTFFYDQVKFCCDDINDTITVVFRVYDVPVQPGAVGLDEYEGHWNDCMVQVYVEDKIKPTCVPPANVNVSCENFDPSLWAYGFATAADNCCIDTITESRNLTAFDTVCNKGTITRTFRAIDCGGQSTTCTQRVFVSYEQDYFVRFPNDVIVTVCDGTGNYGEPVFFGEDCELLGVSHEDEVFTVVPDACYKIERTWTIINWCTYNPNAGCVEVPNPNPNAIVNHPQNLTGPTVSALGTPSPWTPSNVPVAPGQANTNYSVFYHGGTYNGIQIPNIANNNCFKYKQIIKVIDTQDPIVANCPASPVEVCDLSPNDPLYWNKSYWYDATTMSHDLCEAPTDLTITATDLCSGAAVNIHYLLFLDLDGDGTMETVINSVNTGIAGLGWNAVPFGNANNPNYGGGTIRQFDDRPVPSNQKYGFAIQTTINGNNKTASVRWNTQQAQNNYVIPELPYGTHKIKWFVEDGCGNETICEYTFVVKDCKKPTVVCLNGLSVNIMPTKMITLWASDFLQYTEDNCTPSNKLVIGIRKSGTGTGFPLNPDGTPQTSVTFTCDELGTQLVELWSIDLAGNADYCETYVVVQDNAGICSGNSGTVAGALKTEDQNGLEEANVELEGGHPSLPPASMLVYSDNQGQYTFNGVPYQGDYTVTPTKDNDPLNGVSTFDLVLINKHILGLEPLNSPYKMIAADANNSRSITTFDIVELRKLILGIYNELPNNTSWRFVDEAYSFPNPSNPFMDIFPETKQIADMQASMFDQDFVAVKVGDVNNNAVTSSLTNVQDRTEGTLLFDVQDRTVKAGETFTVNFKAAEKVLGYQFTMYFPNLEVTNVTGGAEMSMTNFGIFNSEHAMTTSFDNEHTVGEFSVTFRSKAAGTLSEMLTVSSRITKAEAYDLSRQRQAVGLRFNGQNGSTISGLGFELYQNQPNPWLNKTQIGFYLPEAAEATLTIFDETGRMLFTQTGDFTKGYNAISLERSLINTTGVLYYKVETATDSAVKKMIQTK